MNESFSALVHRIMEQGNLSQMQPVVEKELLHYDIIYCLEKKGLLDDLVFQGGTSLRLCRGGSRFSEDLDFAGGVDFSADKLKEIKTCIEEYIGKRYGLEVTVKEPSTLKELPEYAELRVDKWQVVVVTAPGRKELPKQKIKLEIANVPAHQPEPVALNINYEFLPEGYAQTIVVAESINEVFADKIISLPATQNYVRYRDIWDLVWLTQHNAKFDEDLVRRKIEDYRLDNYQAMLDRVLERIPSMIGDAAFKEQMVRFLPTDIVERTLESSKFIQYLEATLISLFKDVKSTLFEARQEFEFKM
ncbi:MULTISPECIES: nucleotidyl transferase AbiEii/AbiGii toxin family protein [Shewanella]|uniref:Nucleotidyl transferase AbiEii/AbiGii toxin family protein n=1 Tax=Shewanella marisflavi TaxID=260364 RepID=A0ABX5WMQ3_9GAMM|nr:MULTISPECIES: nucleotidyl transferase AbiEii/AbiGii toxin family protein [Shewanella]MCL1040948.1 nucleotidyl transferase AbiEii/AbiGii toxin family protein [Shewanella marisflavi]QDF75842.1 nucleotidyl transferase AbiEii/AbiGii toxin family protein [Shewanella marisflavi]